MSDNKTIQDALAEVQRKINEQQAARVSEIIDEASATVLNPAGKKVGTTSYQKVPGSSVAKAAAGRSLIGRAAGSLGGPAGIAAVAAAPYAAEKMKQSHEQGHASFVQHPTTPGVKASDSFERMRQMKSDAPAPAASPKPAAPAPTPGKPAAPKPTEVSKPETSKGGYFMKSPNVSKGDYEIKKGDTLSGIAKSHGTSVGAIQSMNKGLTDVNKIAAGGSLNLPTATKSTVAPAAAPAPKPETSTPSAAPAPSTTPVKDFVKDTMSGKVETPIMDRIKGKTPEESESGGKKKKMSEESNPLIAAFLKLQSENSENMFEAAKKAKKDYDKDGKIESPKDEVWGSRFAAAKKAGKMEEGNIDPVVTGSSSVTKSKTGYVDPSTPTKPYEKAPMSTAAGDVLDKAKDALDKKGVKEETDSLFSAAELEHLNRFFLEASVAPNRPEVAVGADSTSDKMSQNDVTGTSTESGGKKKVKEETDAADETNMAKTQLKAMSSKAMNLHSKLKTSKNLPAWVQSKLAVAKDGVTAVDDYMTHSGKIKEDIELEEGDLTIRTLYNKWAGHASGYNEKSGAKANAVEKAITKVHGPKVMSHLKKALNANLQGNFDRENSHFEKARTAAGKSEMIGATVGSGRSEFKKTNEETLQEAGMPSSVIAQKQKLANMSDEEFAEKHGNKSEKELRDMAARHGYGWDKATKTGSDHYVKRVASIAMKEETLQEGRPKKNPTPETTERDPRKHIQVEAGRAAAGNVIDFHHNDGTKSKITPAMGRRITSHLNGLKPADRQAAVNKMHDSAEGLKV